jgi:hypothetical protein
MFRLIFTVSAPSGAFLTQWLLWRNSVVFTFDKDLSVIPKMIPPALERNAAPWVFGEYLTAICVDILAKAVVDVPSRLCISCEVKSPVLGKLIDPQWMFAKVIGKNEISPVIRQHANPILKYTVAFSLSGPAEPDSGTTPPLLRTFYGVQRMFEQEFRAVGAIFLMF